MKNKGKTLYFREIIALWKKDCGKTLKKSTLSTYYGIADKHIRPYFGEMLQKDLGDRELHKFMAYKSSPKQQLSPRTLTSIYNVLRSILNFATAYGFVTHPEILKSKGTYAMNSVSTMSQAECLRLTNYFDENISTLTLGIFLSAKTGMRVGEICGLRWSDIHLDQSYLFIKRTVQRVYTLEATKRKTELHIGEPKSQSSRRKIPISPSLHRILSVFKEKCSDNDAFVLTSSAEKPLDPRRLQSEFKRVLKELGMRDMNFHCLRHSFATNCVEKGFDIKALSMILGHSDVSVTLNIYVHPSFERMQEMMAMID